jgi:multidrug resistance protein
MADLEKQGFQAATTPFDEHHEEIADVVTPIDNKHKQQRSISKTFAPHEKPSYTAADGSDSRRHTPVRTFSRRTMQSEASNDDANYFGGTLSRTRTNMEIDRVESRQQQRESSMHDGSSHDEKEADDNTVVVNWEGEDDPENPQNFGWWYKVYVTVFGAILVLNSTFSSSAPNGVSQSQIAYFGFSQEVNTLTISLWVAGYCLGPLVWGPLSERLGRRPVFLISIFAYTCWDIGCALSKNTASILVFRFLGGVFGAAPLTNSGGIIADVWDSKARGIAMSLFAVAPFAGPALGPVVSGAIQVTGTSWRWVYWTITIFSGICWVICFFTLRETYAPAILSKKAKRIRKETGDDFYKSPLDLTPLTPKNVLHDTVAFPFIMLVQEPILLAMGLYLSFVYGIIYLCFGAYPIIFEQVHGFNALIGGVMFLPLFMGGIAGVAFYIAFINPRYSKKVEIYAQEKKGRVPPEERLWVVCIAAPCLVISFFWLGWTSFRSISFWSPMLAGALLGFAVLLIFVGLFNYIVDAYLANAASALAGNTVMRSAFGAGFPLFTVQMFDKLTIKWTCTLLGGIALILAPIPFALLKYGPKIRALSKHTA